VDLNPVIASLGNDLTSVTSGVGSALGDTASNVGERGMQFDIDSNILYSVNDYSGNTHTNRVLEQDGSVVDQFLDNDGVVHSQKNVGNFAGLMRFTGYNVSATFDGESVRQLEYSYAPFQGFFVLSAVFLDGEEKVVGTRVLSETSAGGTSTIGNGSS